MRWVSFGSLNSSTNFSRRSGRQPGGGHKIIAPAGVRDRDDHRLLGEVEPGNGIKRVEIGSADHLEIGGVKLWDSGKTIHGAAARRLARLAIGELLAG